MLYVKHKQEANMNHQREHDPLDPCFHPSVCVVGEAVDEYEDQVMVMVRIIPWTWIRMELMMYWIDLQPHVPQAKRLIREEFKNDRL